MFASSPERPENTPFKFKKYIIALVMLNLVLGGNSSEIIELVLINSK